MDNICVMCGRELPTECDSMICNKCQKGNNHVRPRCYDCGERLELINISRYNTTDGFGYSTIYHCNSCHADWEQEEEYISQPIKFKRKFWG